jgi:hypothetical protein
MQRAGEARRLDEDCGGVLPGLAASRRMPDTRPVGLDRAGGNAGPRALRAARCYRHRRRAGAPAHPSPARVGGGSPPPRAGARRSRILCSARVRWARLHRNAARWPPSSIAALPPPSSSGWPLTRLELRCDRPTFQIRTSIRRASARRGVRPRSEPRGGWAGTTGVIGRIGRLPPAWSRRLAAQATPG